MPYIGNDLQVAFPSYTSIDDISASFNGVLKTFPLRVSGSAPVPFPINPQQCLISVNNVVQKPDPTGTTGFNLVGTDIVFATAPTAGWNFFGVILAGADYVTVGTKFPAGSAAVPSITFEGDTDTGIYNVAANELGFTTGGSLKAYINSSGQYLALTGSAGSPIYSFASDSNTGIFSPGADQIGLATAGTARIQFDSNGALGLSGANYGTSGQVLTSNGSGSAPTWQTVSSSVTASGNNTFTGENTFRNASGQTFVSALTTHDGININGRGAGSSSYRISVLPNTLTANRTIYFPNQNGNILVAGNASIANADISTSANISGTKINPSFGSQTIVTTGIFSHALGTVTNPTITFTGDTNTGIYSPGADLVAFATGGAEHARFLSNGNLCFSTTTGINVSSGTTDGISFYKNPSTAGVFQASCDGNPVAFMRRRTSDGPVIQFRRDTTEVGNINVTTTSTSYATSSDYRLKENVVPVGNAIARLQQLKPSRFNFIAEPGRTVDGFLAHEVQAVVPECVTGTKDAVDADGNPIYQGIDQAKLVPLLTAALQEAVAKIEALEARLTAAGI